ncbi:MAG TPA: xanthine dehydrogenase family protein subunit M, partial [Burkholderiales bacterium]|nr:xanthine dehydrogenase family protein subunit M [Burkholderiales bacterium]
PDGAVTGRKVPLSAFFTGPGGTVRKATELLTAVEVPLPPRDFVGEFYKHGTRPGLDIAAIAIAAGACVKHKVLTNVRIAFGAVAPTPIRAPRTETVLEGRTPDAATLDAAADAALAEIHPISDVRASDWYRRELVRNMLKRVISHVGQL